MAECEDADNVVCTMDEFLEGRTYPSISVLFQHFVPCVVGKKKFKAKMTEHLTHDAGICSVSDEAFTLLLLENQYDRWKDIYHQRKTRAPAELLGRMERRKRKWESDVNPKYTEGGIRYSDGRKMTHKGWREAGIVRFNELCAKVHRDRTEHPQEVVGPLLEWWRELNQGSKQKVKEADDVVAGTSAYHELWEEDNEPPTVTSPPTGDTSTEGQVSL